MKSSIEGAYFFLRNFTGHYTDEDLRNDKMIFEKLFKTET
jgi:hypothetical protein